MNRSKKIFLACVLLFFAFLLFIIFDIGRKTTFPGSKNMKTQPKTDSVAVPRDSLQRNPSPKSTTHQP